MRHAMRPRLKRSLTNVLFSATFLLAGCGGVPDQGNLSPKAGDDPARLEKAEQESKQAAVRAKKAELARTRGRIQVEGQ